MGKLWKDESSPVTKVVIRGEGQDEEIRLEGDNLLDSYEYTQVEDQNIEILVELEGMQGAYTVGLFHFKNRIEEEVKDPVFVKVTTLDGVEIELDRAKEWNRGLGYISLVKEQEGYTLLSIEPILDGEYIDRNNGNVIFKPGRYMVKYKTAEGEEQEYKLLVEND